MSAVAATEPTHVIVRKILIPGVGDFDIGDKVDADVLGARFGYCVQFGFVRSIEDLQAEADAKADAASLSQTQQTLLPTDDPKPKSRRRRTSSNKESKDDSPN